MAAPIAVRWLGAALLLAVAIQSGARLVAAGRDPARRWSDAAHVLMAVGLAAMLAPSADPVPDAAWEALFSAVVGRSLVAALRGRGRSERLMWAHPERPACATP